MNQTSNWIKESEIAPYLRDIRKIEVLTAQEEQELILRVNDGDEKAVEELICANLRFVITVAKDYQNQGLKLNDLIGEGNAGLVKAAGRFDTSVGVRFYSYAVHWIRQSIIQALNDNSRTIRLPVNVINDMTKNRKTLNEIEYVDWCVRQGVLRTQSLNKTIDEDGSEYIELISGDENEAFMSKEEEDATLSYELEQVMSILTERERDVITQYYGIGGESLTLQQIANEIDLTKERVRQIKNKAITKLRFNAPLLFKFFHD